ncbi:hypothetical protein BWQ96_00741 [Gracilariopsis chorda]|uniref:Uncharacterized protein n=1 Tax=Gracilariopsis chorda TaxID=448386 RepID=A0A2V3J4V4_9FLOR|nr:hypothetical protein BWQ96_00741 [Gracilariopsis chorda]|eukprot:PXF49425.1 hypothetical protein BWQ96_00741 [Gracilariopsis chorda]
MSKVTESLNSVRTPEIQPTEEAKIQVLVIANIWSILADNSWLFPPDVTAETAHIRRLN